MGGGIVGAFADLEYHEHTVALEPSAVLALFTDGVTEAAGCIDPREDERLFANVQQHASEDAESIAQAMFARVGELSGGHQRDDVAIVVIRRGEP